MKIHAIQLDSVWENPAANLDKVTQLLHRTPPAAGSLIILPEMFSTGFSLDPTRTIQRDREIEKAMAALAAQYRATIIGGLVNAGPDGRARNEAVAIDPAANVLIRYVKQQPFSGAGEDKVHVAGDKTMVFQYGGFTIAPLICYDLRFPELFRAGLRAGAELFIVMAAWPAKRVEHWLTLLRARAIENQAYVIGVNRCGKEPHFVYPGRSVVVNPHGEIIADAGATENVITAEIDPAEVRSWRAEFPAVRDAR